MSAASKNFYEVLGVKRRATAQEIEQAYARLRSQLQQESGALDPRRAAIVKVAYTTLSDPEVRSQYDDQLGFKRKPVRVIDLLVWTAGGVVLLGLAWWVYQWQMNRTAALGVDAGVDVARLVHDMGPRVVRVEAAQVSGDVRDLGLAVETGDSEMTAVCPELAPGTALTVNDGSASSHAEIAQESGGKGLCTLAVKGVRGAMRLRTDVPQPKETLQAVVRTGGAPSARAVGIARTVDTPLGTALVVTGGEGLPNGAPIFDMRERLVGIVIGTNDAVPGAVLALPLATSASPPR
jgi:hypothetical protein